MADWLEHHYGAKIELVQVDPNSPFDFERVRTNELKAARFELYYFYDPRDRFYVWVRHVQRVYYEPVLDLEFLSTPLQARHIDLVRIPPEEAGAPLEPFWRKCQNSLLPNILKYSRFELLYCQDPENPAYTLCHGTYRIDYPAPPKPDVEPIPVPILPTTPSGHGGRPIEYTQVVTPTKKTSATKRKTPVNKPSSVKKATPAKKSTPAKKPTSAKKSTPIKNPSTKKPSSSKKKSQPPPNQNTDTSIPRPNPNTTNSAAQQLSMGKPAANRQSIEFLLNASTAPQPQPQSPRQIPMHTVRRAQGQPEPEPDAKRQKIMRRPW
ncbi:hypothetical protein HYFRA_00003678 [Hymenoscyphus fraxineus]|uniref:Uncharacterized protein n=1 Tax=Hymenoscyphus fraxineus TaxID=746836 RepID=A0A9N9L0Z6_9HELO|nr:hypothetical protein HYFRA_00003678 [Hymenoscyphus fraxineus]